MSDPTSEVSMAGVNGGRCDACEAFFVPRAAICPVCLGDAISPSSISGEGTVYSSTVVRSGPRDRTLPYGLAHVDLDAGIRVLVGYEADGAALSPGTFVTVAEVDKSPAGLPLLRVVAQDQRPLAV